MHLCEKTTFAPPEHFVISRSVRSIWQEIKAVQLEDSLIEGEGEMDVSDSEEEPQRKKSRIQTDGNEDVEKLQSLKEENDSLRCQLEAYKNEVRAIKHLATRWIEAMREIFLNYSNFPRRWIFWSQKRKRS